MSEVFFSPFTAIHENFPPGTLVVGQPGGGKSYCLLNIAAGAMESGGTLFVLDAKNDMLALRNIFPNIKVTDVNNISPGSLDPFLVFPDVDSTVILTITEMMTGKLETEQKLAVTPIIGDFVRRAKSGAPATFRDFSDYLYRNENKHAQAIGNSLILISESKYGKLIFGEPGKRSRALKLNNESRIISILGMELPSGSNIVKTDEQFNAAVIYIICRMIKALLTNKSKNGKIVDKTPTVFVLDECHMLMRSQAIADIIDEFLVLGRSLGVSVLLASQNVTHFPDSISQYVSTKICFRLSKKEANEFFHMFDMSANGKELDLSETIDIATRLKTGYCFFIDKENRCALVHIESAYDSGDITSNPLMKKSVENKSALNIKK